MYKPIKEEDAVGKTVKKIFSGYSFNGPIILFTDDTFVRYGIDWGYYEGDARVEYQDWIDKSDISHIEKILAQEEDLKSNRYSLTLINPPEEEDV